MNVNDYETIERIKQIYSSIEETMHKYGNEDVFCKDTDYFNSVCLNVARLSREVIYNLSDDFKSIHKDSIYFKGYEALYRNIRTNYDDVKKSPFGVWSLVNAEVKNDVSLLTHLVDYEGVDYEEEQDRGR